MKPSIWSQLRLAALVILLGASVWLGLKEGRVDRTKLALIIRLSALTVTGTLAPVVWGGTGWMAGAEGGLLVLAVGALVVWGSLAHIRSGRG